MVKYKRIIVDPRKDHLIPQVSSKNTPKEIFDALSSLFEGRNVNRRMTLRNQLKSVKIQKDETMQSYFTRLPKIKEQLESIGDTVWKVEIVMTTLSGLPRIGTPSSKEYVLEESWPSSVDYGKNVYKKKKE